MSIVKLRNPIKKEVDRLPAARLELANGLLAVLNARGEDETFQGHLKRRPPIEQRLREADANVQAGRLTPVSKLKRKCA